ncbi:hypothetical protein RB195_017594 [Necator americanus]|uniref:G-protein coupled receptors family 1 profile domain-containing protein n=1 Tax=Necator americanus TaxID=51031 RepID=A0ABR1C927_NECAM
MDFFLTMDFTALFLEILAIVLNGIVLLGFFHTKRDSASLRLLSYLTLTDFLHAVTMVFHTIYLIHMWNPSEIRMNPYIVMLTSTPLTLQLKINLTLTVAIALDRTLALCVPVRYRMISPSLFATSAIFLAVLCGISDIIVEFTLSPISPKPNCAAVGCFVSIAFRNYWGTSNMVLGLAVILLTTFLLIKLRQVEARSRQWRAIQKFEGTKFTQGIQFGKVKQKLEDASNITKVESNSSRSGRHVAHPTEHLGV